MCYNWPESEWTLSQPEDEYTKIGGTLNIDKIISSLKLSAHDVAEAEEVYGKKPAQVRHLPKTKKRMRIALNMKAVDVKY